MSDLLSDYALAFIKEKDREEGRAVTNSIKVQTKALTDIRMNLASPSSPRVNIFTTKTNQQKTPANTSPTKKLFPPVLDTKFIASTPEKVPPVPAFDSEPRQRKSQTSSVMRKIRKSVTDAAQETQAKEFDVKQFASKSNRNSIRLNKRDGSVTSRSDNSSGPSAATARESQSARNMKQAFQNAVQQRFDQDDDFMAIRIQRLYRGYRARLYVGELIWDMIESGELVL
jgi:hypothetical protein